MSQKIARRLGLSLLVIFCVAAAIITALFFEPDAKTSEYSADDYRYELTFVKQLAEFPILKQQTAYTCNVTSMAIVRNFLGVSTTEQSIRSELGVLSRTSGMLPNKYLHYAKQAFQPIGLTVTLENPTSQTEVLNLFSESLARGLPVIVFYAAPDAWNMPEFNTHYAVVYGVDMQDATVQISNPYGYAEQLAFADLFSGLDFSSYAEAPFSFRLARTFGLVKPNSLFILRDAA